MDKDVMRRRRLIADRLRINGWSLDDACNRRSQKTNRFETGVSISAMARKHGLNYMTIYSRLNNGMSVLDAVSEPSKRKRLTKSEILKAKALGISKYKTAEFILKCSKATINKKLKEYGIEWRESHRTPKPVTVNGVQYANIKEAIEAHGMPNTAAYYKWAKTRKGTKQELVQQYIDFRAAKK